MKQKEEIEYQMKVVREVMRKEHKFLAALAEFDRTGKNPDRVEEGLKQKKSSD